MYNVRKMRCCFIHLCPLPDYLCSNKQLYPLQKLPQFILRYSDNVFVCCHIAVTEVCHVSRDSDPDGTCRRMQGTYSGNDQNMGTFLYTNPYPGYIFVVPYRTKANSAVFASFLYTLEIILEDKVRFEWTTFTCTWVVQNICCFHGFFLLLFLKTVLIFRF